MTKRAELSSGVLTIAQTRASLADVVRRAERGEEIRITRRGVPVAVVRAVRADEDERADRFRSLVARMRAAPIAGDGPEDPWADVRDKNPGRPSPNFRR